MGAIALSSSSWQCQEWCMDATMLATAAYSVFILDNFMQAEFNASIPYIAHKVKLHQ